MNKITFSIHESFSKELKFIWDKFELGHGWSPFQNFSFLASWYNEVGRNINVIPKIIIIQNDEEVIAILPFSIRQQFRIEILEWLGGIHSDYKGPIINSKLIDFNLDFEYIWKSICGLIGKIDIINLNRQPSIINGNTNPFYSQFESFPDIKSYRTELTPPWEIFFESKIKKKQIADSKRQIKRLNSFGELKFVVSNELINSKKIIKKMIELKRIRYNETNSFDYLKSIFNRNFFYKLIEINDPSIKIHVSSLLLNNEIISTHVGIIWSNKFYYLMPSNENNKYKAFSTGRLLLEELIKDSLNNGISFFDFTIGSEEYKKSWCNIEEQLYQSIVPYTTKGFFYKLFLNFKKSLYANNKSRLFVKMILKIIRFK